MHCLANRHKDTADLKEVEKIRQDGRPCNCEQQEGDDLQSLENGDRNIGVRRDAEREHANDAKKRHDDFREPRHLKTMLDRFAGVCNRLNSDRFWKLAKDLAHRDRDFAYGCEVFGGLDKSGHEVFAGAGAVLELI